jgi:predicted RNA-binding Zn-ribbon protein involved in translation (DUF1610 family)
MSNELSRFRNNLDISAMGSVNINIGVDFYGKDYARFDCVSCDRPLQWTKRYDFYECAECGYEMTSQEAIKLCDKYNSLIDLLAKEAGKKRSFWRRLFGL